MEGPKKRGRPGVSRKEASNKASVDDVNYNYANVEGYDATAHTVKRTVSLTVKEAAPTVTAPEPRALTYTGKAQKLITAGSAIGGAMQYSPDGRSFSETIPTGTNAGTYYVWYMAKGDDNHLDSDPSCVSVTVNKAASTPATVTANTLTYTGAARALVTADKSTLVGGTMEYALGKDDKTAPTADWSEAVPTATDAGTYYVWYRVVPDENHGECGPYCAAAVILNGKVEPKDPTGESLTYSGKDQPLVKAGAAEGGTLLYVLGKDGKTAPTEGWSETIPTGRDAGTYHVWYKVKGDKNHNDTDPAALKATIARKSLVVTPEAKGKTYGKADPELTWTQEGLVDGDKLDVTLKRAEGENVGNYAITADKYEASDNYEVGVNEAVFTIEARSVTVTAKDQTVTEGEAIETGVTMAKLSGQVEGHALSAVTLTAGDGTITASGAKIADAEGVDVTANYSITYEAGKLTVAPKVKAVERRVLLQTKTVATLPITAPLTSAVSIAVAVRLGFLSASQTYITFSICCALAPEVEISTRPQKPSSRLVASAFGTICVPLTL